MRFSAGDGRVSTAASSYSTTRGSTAQSRMDGPGGWGSGAGARQSRSSSIAGGGRGDALGVDPEWGQSISEHRGGAGDGGGENR